MSDCFVVRHGGIGIEVTRACELSTTWLMFAMADCWCVEEDDDDERECGNNCSTAADCWCIKEDDDNDDERVW